MMSPFFFLVAGVKCYVFCFFLVSLRALS
jgi:hypothetical protein